MHRTPNTNEELRSRTSNAITVYLLFCCFAVCPVPMNKEEEEIIKEQERNREEMEEIMREIEISCLGEW